MIDRRQSMCYEGAKTEGGGRTVVLRWFAPNWNEMAESQKEIHSRPLQLRWRLVSRNDFASRAEIFVPSTTAMRCPTSLFFHASHCFCPLWRADQHRNIYPLSFGGFNVFQNFGQARFAGCCHGIDGREMMDSVKLNDVSRHLFLVTRRSTF